MVDYKIKYFDGTSEMVKAANIRDVGSEWIVFEDGQGSVLLRVRAADVIRVEAA